MRLADVGLPYVSNGTPGSAQATADSWYETSAGEKAQTAQPPVATNLTRCQTIMAGDVYAFNRPLANARKFPPHLDDHLFIFDWEQNVADAAKVSDVGDRLVVDTVINVKSLLGLGTVSKVIDGTFTPAGTLMVSSELGTVYHVEYTGSCVQIGPTSARPEAVERDPRFALRARGMEVYRDGYYTLSLHDGKGRFLQGREVTRPGYHSYSRLFPGVRPGQVYLLRATYASHSGKVTKVAPFAAF